jgi:hypothetical protein
VRESAPRHEDNTRLRTSSAHGTVEASDPANRDTSAAKCAQGVARRV